MRALADWPSGRSLLGWALVVGVAVCLLLLISCSSLAYYTQSVVGGARILAKREPIERILARGEGEIAAEEAEKRRKLELVLEVLEFARSELGLEDGGSYRSYVELDRPYVVWNVVAAPELAMEARSWCFLFAGCVSYRGYFSERRAVRFASKLKREGFDVSVGGVTAYSTLGWFRDPVLSTFLRGEDWRLVGLLIHELVHQRLYVKGDTELNESLATFVEELGLGFFLEQRSLDDQIRKRAIAEERQQAFTELVLTYREKLRQLYKGRGSAAHKRVRKEQLFGELKEEYLALRSEWKDGPVYDGWFERELNNADLVTVADYHGLVPALESLYEREGGLPPFFAAVEELAELSFEERRERLSSRRRRGGRDLESR